MELCLMADMSSLLGSVGHYSWLTLKVLFGVGLVIFVHELGHFLAAKWAGIRTEGFAIGMGPVVFSWRKGIGFCAGSTQMKYDVRLREHLQSSNIPFRESKDLVTTRYFFQHGDLPVRIPHDQAKSQPDDIVL